MARAYRGRPPKRRVTVRKDSINPGSFFGADNYERLRQEVATQGTIDGERLSPEERKEAFKASKSKVDFNKFVSSFFGVEKPKTQTGVGQTPPPAVPRQNLLPAAPGTSAIAVRNTTQQTANRQSAAESAEEQDADSVKERKKRKSGATLEQNVAAIRKTVDSIFETLVKQNDFIRKQFGLARKLEENKKRKGKEERFEEGKGDKKAKKAVDKVVKPFSSILDKIINFFASILLGKALIGLIGWFGDPDNQSKVSSIGRFLKDWWPALLGAYLIFGNGLSKFIIGITAKLVFFAGRMLLTVIPALGKAIARNPKAAAAVALLGAGAVIPAMFPDTVKDAADKQADDAEKEVGKEKAAAQIEAQNKDRGFFGQIGDFFTGAGAEREEQAERLRTGKEKTYGFFGEIPAKRKGGEITTTSGTDIKGAGVDTQLIAARPGEVVINKATVDSVGADYFLGLNKKFGGPQANKPKMAKGVQAAEFGGMVLPAFANGGRVGQSVPTGGTYMAERGERLRDDLVKWATANPALASTLKAGDTGYKEAKSAATKYGNAIFNNGFTGLEQGLSLGQQTIESLGPSLQQGAMSIASQGESFLGNIVNTGDSIVRDVQQKYESGELENQLVSGLESAQTTGKGLLNQGRATATNAVAGTFDGLSNIAGSDTYKGLAKKNAAVDEKEISIADSIVDSLPEGSPLQDIADKGLIPIPSGDASTMRNLTFVKALLGPLGKPFKILSNDQVDKMRQKTIDMTLDKSGLVVGSDGEVKMNWNQEDVNKGAKGGGAYTDNLGPGGKAFNSILGRFTASTRKGGDTLYTDDRYNFNLSTQEYLQKAKEQLLGGAFGEAAYFGAASLGKFAEDIGWLNQRALGSRIAVGQVDRNEIEGATPKVAPAAPKPVTSAQIGSATQKFDKGNYNAATRALGGDPTKPLPTPTITPTVKQAAPKREWYDPRGWVGKQGGGIIGMQGGGFNLLNPMSWLSGQAQKATKGEMGPVKDNSFAGKLYNRRLKQEEAMKMLGRQGGGMSITESTGMNLPGAGADRQMIRVQPGEYILPFDTVMRLGGPSAIDNIVAKTDSNSNAAKLGLNKPQSMAVGQPVMSDDSAMVSTLPPIVQASGGGGYGSVGKGPEVPSVSVSSNASRRRAKTMFGLVG